MSFSERNKLGFKMAMKKDLGFFFGLEVWLCSKPEPFFADRWRWYPTIKSSEMQTAYDFPPDTGKVPLQKGESEITSKGFIPFKRVHGSRDG